MTCSTPTGRPMRQDDGLGPGLASHPFLDALPQMASLWRRDGTMMATNSPWRSFWGARSESWKEAVHPDDRGLLEEILLAAMQLPDLRECRFRDEQGNWHCLGLAVSVVGEGGEVDAILVSAFALERYKRREAELQGTHDLLTRMLDASDDCIKVLAPSGHLRHMNRAGCVALGVSDGSGFGLDWLSLLPPEVRALGTVALDAAARGEIGRFPGKSALPGQLPQFWDNMLTPLIEKDGSISDIICISRNVTTEHLRGQELLQAKGELQRALDAKAVLAGEMLHRVKNLFAVANGLISMAKREMSLDETGIRVLGGLQQRLLAMARATEMLVQQQTEAASSQFDPMVVADAVMRPYSGHFRITGATPGLSQNVVAPLVLLVHELATNSLKHGALSRDTGMVDLHWTDTDGTIRLDWIERGGPPVAPRPGNEGFGSTMLRKVAAMTGWQLDLDWRPGGLRVEVAMTGE